MSSWQTEWGYVRLGTGASTFNGVAVDAREKPLLTLQPTLEAGPVIFHRLDVKLGHLYF